MMKIYALAAFDVLLVIAWVVALTFGHVHVTTYSAAQNAGVVVSGFGHSCGFEYRGVVGTFCDVE